MGEILAEIGIRIIAAMAIVGLFGFGIYEEIQAENAFVNSCHARDGHVKEVDNSVVTTNGKSVGVGTTTTEYCITKSGIIDVRGE